jgi:hypothetical protein
MSALEITRRKNGTLGYCANRCKGASGVKAASDLVSILGHPVGKFCPNCVKEMRQAWDGALGIDSEVVEIPVLRSAA